MIRSLIFLFLFPLAIFAQSGYGDYGNWANYSTIESVAGYGPELVVNGDFHDFTPMVDSNTVALWVFDDVYHTNEATGKTALQDLSGNGHDLTPSAGFDWTNSFVSGNPSYKNGNGLKFDGVDDYGYVPAAQATALNFGYNNFSFELIFKAPNDLAPYKIIYDKMSQIDNDGFYVYTYSGFIRIFLNFLNGYVSVNSGALTPGGTHYVCATIDRAGLMSVYVDDRVPVSASIASKSGYAIDTETDARIGISRNTDMPTDATIYAIKFSNELRTAKQREEARKLAKGWNWDGVGSISNSSFRQVVSGGGVVSQTVSTTAGKTYKKTIQSVTGGTVTSDVTGANHSVTLTNDTYLDVSVKEKP